MGLSVFWVLVSDSRFMGAGLFLVLIFWFVFF